MLIVFPHKPGSGGPGSFQTRIEACLKAKGYKIAYLNECDETPDVVFVIGGSRKLKKLVELKRRGVPIIYRLDGILWLHRRVWPGLTNFLVCEIRNILAQIIHGFLADVVVYQSYFVREWWRRSGWRSPRESTVIHNGVDLDRFSTPAVSHQSGNSELKPDLICLEGHIDYSPYAIDLVNRLAEMLDDRGHSIRMYGGFSDPKQRLLLSGLIEYLGQIPRSEAQAAYREGVYLSLDVNAACPNAVIEALSCGIPVIGLNTGALPELVTEKCGRVVDYGGDCWALDAPVVEPLFNAFIEVSSNYSWFSRNARLHAERHFNIESVTKRYIDVFSDAAGSSK